METAVEPLPLYSSLVPEQETKAVSKEAAFKRSVFKKTAFTRILLKLNIYRGGTSISETKLQRVFLKLK